MNTVMVVPTLGKPVSVAGVPVVPSARVCPPPSPAMGDCCSTLVAMQPICMGWPMREAVASLSAPGRGAVSGQMSSVQAQGGSRASSRVGSSSVRRRWFLVFIRWVSFLGFRISRAVRGGGAHPYGGRAVGCYPNGFSPYLPSCRAVSRAISVMSSVRGCVLARR